MNFPESLKLDWNKKPSIFISVTFLPYGTITNLDFSTKVLIVTWYVSGFMLNDLVEKAG